MVLILDVPNESIYRFLDEQRPLIESVVTKHAKMKAWPLLLRVTSLGLDCITLSLLRGSNPPQFLNLLRSNLHTSSLNCLCNYLWYRLVII